MAPVKVFGPAMSTNVARVLVCLEEVGAEYEVVDIDFKAMEHKSPEHLVRNPFGQIPAFQDGDLLLRNCKVRAPQVQDERSRPAEGRRPEGGGNGGRMDGGGRAHLQPGHLADRVRVPHQPAHARPADQPDGGGREPGEAQKGAGGLRGTPLPARVPGRGLRQLRGPQPLPLHLLLHGHAARGPLRLVPARQGMVGEAHGEAGRQEARRANGSQEAVIC
ncbi:unnamed protein product [Triticum turgidum subsp. durum]|uniref:glutathione transferase n=1 Tax=Triticum turgidum subsp. durum TaxID=4567 RepID=A0A9R0V6G7_TRITD|nr:unnamed protein product [Triticum turgidum subsp. durum]